MLTLLLSGACSAEVTVPDTPTPTPLIIITATLPPTQTPHPSPTPEPATATPLVVPAEGQTTSQLNVRSDPSADGNLLGTVEIFASVQIVGKDPTSSWWMIVYPESPTGTGWITAQFVQVPDPSGVPVIGAQPQAAGNTNITEAGPTVAGDELGVLSPTPNSSLASAFPDGDSAQSPAVSVTLSKTTTRTFNYSSDISTPDGDAEDWVQFILDGSNGQQSTVFVGLDCKGSGGLNVELIQNNSLLQGWENISCGQYSQLQLNLFVGAPYTLHLYPAQGDGSQIYIAYTVIVQLNR